MIRPELIRRKLAHLHGYLGELEPYRGVSLDSYLARGGPRRAVERLLQLLVEVVADINVHVATETEGKPPNDYRDSFNAAARIGLIPSDLATDLMPSAGLRNALGHDYAILDDGRVHETFHLALDGFREYAQAVQRWIQTHEEGQR
ncbi:MAG: type VII toxin-antitoxin system HepT family RNase toxin [Actinomycetota bacterium]